MKLSLIIPVYNAHEDVIKCLKSVSKHFATEHECIIVDDYSALETKIILEEFAEKNNFVKLYRNSENLGFIKTCNFAMKKAKNDIIVLLNSDTVIPSTFCEKIIECFEKNYHISVACPIPSNSGHFSLELPDTLDIEQMNELLCKKHKTQYPLLSSCNGFCFCIRKELTDKIGYFDEVYGRGYHEEIDFCYRAISNGYNCALIDNLYVLHKRHASFGSRERADLIKQNDIVFYARWDGFGKKWENENNYTNPMRKIKEDLFSSPFKVFTKVKKVNGRRNIYFCGIKVFSYNKYNNEHSPLKNYKTKFAPFGYEVEHAKGHYIVKNEVLTIQGPALNTLWTCFDVLCKNDYNFTQTKPYVLFDIGFNIGSTSIFKAQEKECIKVYAFEPFKETLDIGLENIKNNKNGDKITTFNFGLGSADMSIEVHYNKEKPGAMSTVTDVFTEGESTTIQVKQASKILAPLFAKHDEVIALKIDCEGAEFDILEDLHSSKLLQKVKIIVMEWHFQSPQRLIDILIDNGFHVFTEYRHPTKLGFIKAIRG